MKLVLLLCTTILLSTAPCSAETRQQTIVTDYTATDAYERGFAYDVMRSPGNRGVMLNDMVLIEDDGPGAGNSEKGTWFEHIDRNVTARKTFELDRPDAFEAHIVLYMVPKNPDRAEQAPFYIILNGTKIDGPPLSWHEPMWHWVPVPPGFLVRGTNTIVVGSDANDNKGYDLMIARADEYEQGGGMYLNEQNTALTSAGLLTPEMKEESGTIQLISIGKNSAKSVDGGETWKQMALGTTNDVVGEYTVRLNLRRYKNTGTLMSGPIDLWSGLDGYENITPRCTVDDLKLYCRGDIPEGTGIEWQIRFSDTPDMNDPSWGTFTTIGDGPSLMADLVGGKRYLQWSAVLTTDHPLKTPMVSDVRVSRMLTYDSPRNRYYTPFAENVTHRYPSVTFSYERWDEPRLDELRERLNLDDAIVGAEGDWEIINRVRHLVSQQWHHASPIPGYPEWNALEILDRRDRTGAGGMCIQFSIVFIQALASLGYQARHINMFAHETVEVYVDELGKWVHADPESVFDSYEYDTRTGEPINCLEQHRFFLMESGLTPDNPIDWQATRPWTIWGSSGVVTPNPVPLDFSTDTAWINDPNRPDYPPQHRLAGFMRMMPRNDYFSRPYPRPLSQGSSNWPWNGYINWYDDATPRKLQYSLHTDREADFYPTLNRVEYDAIFTDNEDELEIRMITFAPNFDGYEINIDGSGWRDSEPVFVWRLNRSALNRLEMRVKNKRSPIGKASRLHVLYHYKEPFAPRPADW